MTIHWKALEEHFLVVGEDGAQWGTNLLFRDYSNMNGCRAVNEVPNGRGGCCPQVTTSPLMPAATNNSQEASYLFSPKWPIGRAPIPGQNGSPTGWQILIFLRKEYVSTKQKKDHNCHCSISAYILDTIPHTTIKCAHLEHSTLEYNEKL
jgi:hypothetical protein